MIKKTECYYVVCDRCGCCNDEYYPTLDMIWDRCFDDDGFIEIHKGSGTKHYCSDCVDFDEETYEYHVKP